MTVREFSRRPEIKILFSLVLLLIASRLLNWRDLAEAARRLDPWHLSLALIGALLVLLFAGARWALMARALAGGAFLHHMRNYLVGIFISIVTPANIGADIYRFGSFPKGAGRWPVVSLLLQEKVFILLGYLVSIVLTLLAVALAGLALPRDQEIVLAAIGTASALATALIFVADPILGAAGRMRLFSGRFSRLLASVRTVVSLGGPNRCLQLIGLSLLSVLAWLCAVSAIAATVGATLPLLLLWLVAIIADVVRWAPLSLQGLGVREAAFATMFLFFGAKPADGFVIGATAYVLLTAAMVLSGGLALAVDLVASLVAPRRPNAP